MNHKVPFAIDEYYHLYNRGNDKRNIFLDSSDKARFTKLLYLCNNTEPIVFRDIPAEDAYGFERLETIVDIGAYCLMPNHFHLLIREKNDGGITLFMKKLATGYSMYFNLKYKRSGKLTEGIFKSKHADSDEYLRYLFAYIHLNPVKLIEPNWRENGISDLAAAQKFLKNYQDSSLLNYLGKERLENKIINQTAFPEYFTCPQGFVEYLLVWLNSGEEE